MQPPAGADEQHVPFATRMLFGSGSVAEGVKNTAFNVFLLFYYNAVLGVSGTLVGAAIFMALLIDAVTDPLIGSLSDNHRSRWGRRHPFMYTSALPMAGCFWLLFNPPALSETGLFAWLVVFAVGVRASMTLYMIPSNAMVPELTPHYDERTSLISYRYLFGWMGGLVASLLGYWVFFAPSEAFENGQLDPSAYGGFALVCAGMILVAILLASIGTHPLIARLRRPADGESFSIRGLWGEMRGAFANPSYFTLVIALLFAAVATGFNDVVGLFMNTYFWELSAAQMGLIVLFLPISVVIAFVAAPRLSASTDKRRAALAVTTFAVLWGPLPVFLRLGGLMLPNGHPWLLPVLIGHVVLLVAASVGIGILVSSMVTDVVDEHELETGRRQEGIFVSAIAFTAKASSGIGGFFAGVALDVIAFPRAAAPEAVPAGKVFALGLAVGPGMTTFFLILLFFLARYRITRARHSEILAALHERRGSAPG